MKKVLSMVAAAALVAVSCNKQQNELTPPVQPDVMAPISFGATTNVDVTPVKTTTQLGAGTELGVYAFKGASVPSNNTSSAADNVVWSSATNLKYTWVTDAFKEDGTSPKLFWPGSGTTGNNLSFVSYFPYKATVTGTGDGVSNYTLTQDMADQKTGPDYGFAWATLLNVARPNPILPKELTFSYKVAKVSFSIVGDGSMVGSAGIQATNVKAVKVYTTSATGLYKTYKLDLLRGNTSGSDNLDSSTPMELKPEGHSGSGTPEDPFEKDYVTAVGFLVPSTDTDFKTAGITVSVIYNDGVSDQTYTATIKAGVGSLSAPADMSNGLEAGKNYQYTLKLGKSGITFTGKVTDWTDVDGGSIELQ